MLRKLRTDSYEASPLPENERGLWRTQSYHECEAWIHREFSLEARICGTALLWEMVDRGLCALALSLSPMSTSVFSALSGWHINAFVSAVNTEVQGSELGTWELLLPPHNTLSCLCDHPVHMHVSSFPMSPGTLASVLPGHTAGQNGNSNWERTTCSNPMLWNGELWCEYSTTTTYTLMQTQNLKVITSLTDTVLWEMLSGDSLRARVKGTDT